MHGTTDLSTPVPKKRPSTTPPSLLPASKVARLQKEQAMQPTGADDSATEMDEEIAGHFLGTLNHHIGCECAYMYYFTVHDEF